MPGNPAGRMLWRKRVAAAVLIGVAMFAVEAKDTRIVRDTPVARLELYARMQALNGAILGANSATAVLEAWCREHALAPAPKIVALRLKGEVKTPSPQTMERLKVSDASELKYRRVELRCGEVTLSRADNWFVPARLTAQMNATLEDTDTPFGKVVAPLVPMRRTISSQLLWFPLDTHDRALPLRIPDDVFRHEAVLYTREMLPFSEVHEAYQGAALRFPLEFSDAPACDPAPKASAVR